MEKILLEANRVSVDVHSCMKVRGGNGKKGSKKGTKAPLRHFARAEPFYTGGTERSKVSVNDKEGLEKLYNSANIIGFGKFGQKKVENENSDLFNFDYTQKTTPNRKVTGKRFNEKTKSFVSEVKDIGEITKPSVEVNNAVNVLFRKVLAFRGIGEDELLDAFTKRGAQTYAVNTAVYPDRLQIRYKEGEDISNHLENFHRHIIIHTITVKAVKKVETVTESTKERTRQKEAFRFRREIEGATAKGAAKTSQTFKFTVSYTESYPSKETQTSYQILFSSKDCRQFLRDWKGSGGAVNDFLKALDF